MVICSLVLGNEMEIHSNFLDNLNFIVHKILQ